MMKMEMEYKMPTTVAPRGSELTRDGNPRKPPTATRMDVETTMKTMTMTTMASSTRTIFAPVHMVGLARPLQIMIMTVATTLMRTPMMTTMVLKTSTICVQLDERDGPQIDTAIGTTTDVQTSMRTTTMTTTTTVMKTIHVPRDLQTGFQTTPPTGTTTGAKMRPKTMTMTTMESTT